jgi:hypothetical protein
LLTTSWVDVPNDITPRLDSIIDVIGVTRFIFGMRSDVDDVACNVARWQEIAFRSL